MGTTATKASSNGATAADRPKTQYAVLRATDDTETWIQVGVYGGFNDTDAIRNATEASGIEEGTFVAVPARSFRPRKIAVKVRRSLSIS